jgi:transcriptional regulator with XRE-family HTH domain
VPPDLATRLRVAREARGLTARELDRRAGCAEGRARLIERGARVRIEIGGASAYAGALDVTLDWLVHGRGDGPANTTALLSA